MAYPVQAADVCIDCINRGYREQPTRNDLDDLVACYRPANRHQRKATCSERNAEGRFRAFDYAEFIARDQHSFDAFWLSDESLEATPNLPPPGEIAREIVEALRVALEEYESVASDLGAM